MKIEDKYIDELVDLRRKAREQKNWKLSDKIRDYLDTKHSFVFDTKDGQVIYHGAKGTRTDLINQLKEDSRAVKIFNSWLYSLGVVA